MTLFSLRERIRTSRGLMRSGRFTHGAAVEVGRRIREHLDADGVIRTTIAELQRVLRPAVISVWLACGTNPPRLLPFGCSDPDILAPEVVVSAATRARTVRTDQAGDADRLAVPILAPGRRLLGVVLVASRHIDEGRARFAEVVANEAAVALGTALIYERTLADKNKSDAILARVADAVVVTDMTGRICEWNPAAAVTLGVTQEHALGRTCAEIVALKTGGRSLDCSRGCALIALGATGDPTLGVEVWRTREDGRRQPLLANVSFVGDPNGTAPEIVHTLRDLTRQKEADEAKTMFLAMASHELRTPLTVIRGFAQLLSNSAFSNEADRQEALRAIESRSAELNSIVERILLSSRIEAGHIDLVTRDLDVGPIVEDRVAALRTAIGRKMAVHVEADLPHVEADPSAVGVILDHLLDNAAKYSPGGEAIEVEVSSGETHVLVRVSDEGIGMDAEQLAHCFDKFWQAESSDHRKFEGTGIGLYIVRALADALGATIEMRSAPGRGTTVLIAFSRSDAGATVDPDVGESQEVAS